MTTTSASSLLLQTPKNRSAAGANRWYHVLIDCISALNFFSESPITTIPGTHFQIIHQHTRLHLFQSSNSFRQSNCKISALFNKCKLQNMCLQWELCDFLYAQLIINHTNLTRYWKPSSEIFFHFERITWHSTDMSAAHPWFDSPVPTHPEGVLLDYDLVALGAIWLQWMHCHAEETNLRSSEFCGMVCYPSVRSYQKTGTLCS